MLCILSQNTNAWFNLAAEEYLLKSISEDVFMLYRNENALVIGKHQNALKEINLEFVREREIKVARRISGGGTVFHDLGNLNFCFIANGKEGNLVNFRKFTQPVMDVLLEMGLKAEYGGRNDLRINGLKFSGNAEHVWKQRTLHHGTILFSSSLDELNGALKVNLERFKDKAVESVRSGVTNIEGLLEEKMSIEAFSNRLFKHILERYDEAREYSFSSGDLKAIKKLEDEKFSTWEWNFGYSPAYSFNRTEETPMGRITVHIEVEKGKITACKLKKGNKLELTSLEDKISGQPHDPYILQELLENQMPENFISAEEFVKLLF